MNINYRSSRREVAEWYWFMWRRSARLKLYQLFIATCAFAAAWMFQGQVVASPTTRAIISLAVTCVVLAFLPLYPLLAFKPEERQLTIEAEGVRTTIGSRQGTVSWREIAEIVSRGDTLYIVRKNFNAFVIPRRAFSTADERAAFTKAATEWFHRAHSQPAV